MLFSRKARGLAAVVACLAATVLTACGGGGGTADQKSASTRLLSADAYAGICTLEGEKQFTHAYLNDNYLWYSEIPTVDATLFDNVPDYFYSLLTPQRDAYGQYKDRFSFIVSSADADSLLTGANQGYGVSWDKDSQGRTRVAYVEANSPAAAAGLQRGGELVSTSTPGASWYPNVSASISFVYRSSPAAATTTISLSTAAVQEDPVPISQSLTSAGNRRVWYLLFNAHTEGAQDELISALKNAQSYGVQDLVLDMRYNGGGYLYTALTLSSMVTNSGSDGQVFEQMRFNDKRTADTAQSVLLFSGQVQYGESLYPTGNTLPRLALPRVYVLTTENTCSASEAVINSLRGVGVEVVIIGQTTCGKPYGFSRQDNCGFAYFPIEFQGVNAKGFGDYADGFAPTCAAADDFDNPLGTPAERLLATALYHMDNGSCPPQQMATPLVRRAPLLLSTRPMAGRQLLPSRIH